MKKIAAVLLFAALMLTLCACGSKAPSYVVKVVDQNGDAVAAATVQFCTDKQCSLAKSDDKGVATFTGDPYAYEAHVLKVPEGYSCAESETVTFDAKGGEFTIAVTKD